MFRDLNKDRLGHIVFEEFKEWIKKHPKLIDSFFHIFHNELWEVKDGRPILITLK